MQFLGHYPPALWVVLEAAHERYISVQSDFARANASLVALAASLGWLSSITTQGVAAPRWFITAAGLAALSHKEHFVS